MVKWRIKRGDKVAGDVPSSKVRQLATSGKLKKTDQLCKAGTDKWVPAGSVSGLWTGNRPSKPEAALAEGQKKPQAAVAILPSNTTQTASDSTAGTEALPKHEIADPVARQGTADAPANLATHEPPTEQEVAEPAVQQKTATGNREASDEPEISDIETLTEPDDEFQEEPYLETDGAAARPRRKWFVPLIAGCLGSLLLLGFLSVFTNGEQAEVNQQPTQVVQEPRRPQRRERTKSASNLSLTHHFFRPNIKENFEYTVKKFVNNTTVAENSTTFIEKWNTDSEIYFHEKGFRNYGQRVPYRVSNGYVQLKGNKNWFRFLKIDAKIGDKWAPGDGKNGTLDWAGKGEIELVDFITIDSVPVAIVEFTAKLGLAVPSYLVPAALDFGLMEDGSGQIEGKLRFELGHDLGMLRVDAIVSKGTRHKNGGGRDTSDWIFATRSRNRVAKLADAAARRAN